MDERLRKYLRLVDIGNFTKAAADLHISQPALTTTIKNLEREMGAKLLARDGKRLTMTQAGKAVYSTAKDLEDRVWNLELKLAKLASVEPAVRIGMIDSVAEAVFVHNDSFRQLTKQAKVSLIVDNSTRLLAGIEQGEIDIAFVARQSRTLSSTLTLQEIGQEPLILVTSNSGSSSAKKDIDAGILANFVSYNRASTTDHILTHSLTQRGIEVHTIFYSTSPEVILRITLSGEGTAALPYMLVKEPLRKGTLIPLFVQNSCVINRDICMVQRRNRDVSMLTDRIRRHTQNIIAKLQKESSQLIQH